MKKKIDLALVLAGEYKETVDVIEGLSITVSPMTFAEREEVSRKEKVEFIKDPNASSEKSRVDRNMFIGKNMAKFVIKSASISSSSGSSEQGKSIVFKKPQDVEDWLNSLPSSIAEMTIGCVTNFVTFYVRETEAAWNSDPFSNTESEPEPSSPPEASS